MAILSGTIKSNSSGLMSPKHYNGLIDLSTPDVIIEADLNKSCLIRGRASLSKF